MEKRFELMGLLDRFRKVSSTEKPASIEVQAVPGMICAPCSGKGVVMADLPDPVFASGAMGIAYGIEPIDGVLYCPITGVVTATTPTLHALGLETNDGVEVLLHIGVDTVTMKGEGFVSFVSQGQSVVAGEPLMIFDRSKVMAAGFSDTVITVVTNSYDYKQVSAIDARDVHAGQKIIDVELAKV
ncbi:MAG: PTS glucose transporter subunit IIA [Coriobacteriaceae bacterium]|nr:PTS glucose transporter subunit IIA [Coriobacteriaceae bacterium]